MKVLGHLFDYDLAIKVVCFDANGATTFQGIKTRVVTNLFLKKKQIRTKPTLLFFSDGKVRHILPCFSMFLLVTRHGRKGHSLPYPTFLWLSLAMVRQTRTKLPYLVFFFWFFLVG
jgi:hypothetical protein